MNLACENHSETNENEGTEKVQIEAGIPKIKIIKPRLKKFNFINVTFS